MELLSLREWVYCATEMLSQEGRAVVDVIEDMSLINMKCVVSVGIVEQSCPYGEHTDKYVCQPAHYFSNLDRS